MLVAHEHFFLSVGPFCVLLYLVHRTLFAVIVQQQQKKFKNGSKRTMNDVDVLNSISLAENTYVRRSLVVSFECSGWSIRSECANWMLLWVLSRDMHHARTPSIVYCVNTRTKQQIPNVNMIVLPLHSKSFMGFVYFIS